MEEDELIKVTPDKERAKSMLEMVKLREKRIEVNKNDEFATLLLEDYYELIKELSTALINVRIFHQFKTGGLVACCLAM